MNCSFVCSLDVLVRWVDILLPKRVHLFFLCRRPYEMPHKMC